MHHNEPVLRDGQVVGYVTSGAFSAHFNCAVGLCLIDFPSMRKGKTVLPAGDYAVMIEGESIPAEVSVRPFYDPRNERMLS